jgi:hypothetical protein
VAAREEVAKEGARLEAEMAVVGTAGEGRGVVAMELVVTAVVARAVAGKAVAVTEVTAEVVVVVSSSSSRCSPLQ